MRLSLSSLTHLCMHRSRNSNYPPHANLYPYSVYACNDLEWYIYILSNDSLSATTLAFYTDVNDLSVMF